MFLYVLNDMRRIFYSCAVYTVYSEHRLLPSLTYSFYCLHSLQHAVFHYLCLCMPFMVLPLFQLGPLSIYHSQHYPILCMASGSRSCGWPFGGTLFKIHMLGRKLLILSDKKLSIKQIILFCNSPAF